MSMVDSLLFAKEGEDTVPNVTGTTIGTEMKGDLCGAGSLGALLGLEKEALAARSRAMLGFVKGGSLKRLSLGKAQLEVGRACLLKGGENFHSSPKEVLHVRCPSFPSMVMGPPQGLDPCVSFPTASEANLKPLADIAILEEVLRFEGTLSSSHSFWGEGPSSSSTPLWVPESPVLGGDCKGTTLIQKLRGGPLSGKMVPWR